MARSRKGSAQDRLYQIEEGIEESPIKEVNNREQNSNEMYQDSDAIKGNYFYADPQAKQKSND